MNNNDLSSSGVFISDNKKQNTFRTKFVSLIDELLKEGLSFADDDVGSNYDDKSDQEQLPTVNLVNYNKLFKQGLSFADDDISSNHDDKNDREQSSKNKFVTFQGSIESKGIDIFNTINIYLIFYIFTF